MSNERGGGMLMINTVAGGRAGAGCLGLAGALMICAGAGVGDAGPILIKQRLSTPSLVASPLGTSFPRLSKVHGEQQAQDSTNAKCTNRRQPGGLFGNGPGASSQAIRTSTDDLLHQVSVPCAMPKSRNAYIVNLLPSPPGKPSR